MPRVDVGLIAYRDRLGDPFLFLEERLVVLRAGERREVHHSPVPKVVFVLEGNHVRHGFSGANQPSPEPVGPGHVIVNFTGCPHFYEAIEAGRGGGRMRALRLTFDAAFLAPVPAGPTPGGASAEFATFVRRGLPAAGQARGEAFARSLPGLRAALTETGPGARLRINALARCALLDVVNAWPGEISSSPGKNAAGDDSLVVRVENFLEARLGEPLRLRDVARAVDRSEEHVVRRFRERRGVTVFAHLRRLRIERARYLLLCSEQSVGRIAAETGFATLAHFSRCFRQDAGTSPSDYRARGGRA